MNPYKIKIEWMNGVSGHDSALEGYTGPVTTWTNEMNFVMNHAPGAWSIGRPIDQQSSANVPWMPPYIEIES